MAAQHCLCITEDDPRARPQALAAVEDPHAAEMGFEIHQDVISDGLTVKRGACRTEHDVSAIVISPLHDGGDVSGTARTDNHLRDEPVGARI